MITVQLTLSFHPVFCALPYLNTYDDYDPTSKKTLPTLHTPKEKLKHYIQNTYTGTIYSSENNERELCFINPKCL